MKNPFCAAPRLSVFALALAGGVAFAGDPIVFIRAQADNISQVPEQQVDRKISAALDSLDAPNPLDNALSVPTGERPRAGREPSSRRAELARKERENWIWYDRGDLQEEEEASAGLDTYEIETDERLPGERDNRRTGLRQSAAERRVEERETRIPAHLQSPQTRQRIQAEAAASRQLQSQFSDEGAVALSSDVATGVDLSKMLTPSQEATSTERLREFLGGASEPPTRSAPPGIVPLGAAGGAELNAKPVIGPLRLGPDLERYSFMDRSTSPELPSSPRMPPPGAPSTFAGNLEFYRAYFQAESGAGVPRATPGGGFSRGPEVPDYAPPRRGGVLGR